VVSEAVIPGIQGLENIFEEWANWRWHVVTIRCQVLKPIARVAVVHAPMFLPLEAMEAQYNYLAAQKHSVFLARRVWFCPPILPS
jgi:hypothetical protein